MDIKERLQLIDKLPRNKNKIVSQQRVDSLPGPANIEQLLGGQMVETPSGRYFCLEKTHPVDYRHGVVPLLSYLESDASLLHLLVNDPEFGAVELEQTLFIDTETTGLSGGAGTCAFLVGVGYFQDSEFRVVQYFMNDFDEEHALMETLAKLVSRFQVIVSYNGKSYDIPLLNSRYIYQGLKSEFQTVRHFDLLHTVRRLWKHRLPDCSLATAEQHLIKNTREGDIPGYLIPITYFDYLRTKDAGPLKSVFYHNQQDILSMVALMAKAMHVLQNPLHHCENGEELLRVGKLYEACRRYGEAGRLYQSHLENGADESNEQELLIRMAYAYKKLNQWNRAVKAWQACVETKRFHPLPYIELAKHYEHRVKDVSAAKKFVDKALKEMMILANLGRRTDWDEYGEDLKYRLQRLERKLDAPLAK